MAALLALHPLFDASHPSTVFWGVLLLFTLASATQDIAIDAHTIAILPKEEVGAANGIRVAAYRVAMIASGGGIVFGAGILGWPRMWFAAGSAAGAARARHPARSRGGAAARGAAALLQAARRLAREARRGGGGRLPPPLQARRPGDHADDQAVLGRSRPDAQGDRPRLDHARHRSSRSSARSSADS